MGFQEQGVAVAREILETFDRLVDEVHLTLDPRPAPAEAFPRLESLYDLHAESMRAHNVRLLGLGDVEARGAAFSYLDEHRPRSVHRKDERLGQFVFHYRYEQADERIVEFLNRKLAGLIDIATAH